MLDRRKYLDCLKQNYLHVLSVGLHGCTGARYGETFAAGRAFLTDPLAFTHQAEEANHAFYEAFIRPDVRILATLKTAFPDQF